MNDSVAPSSRFTDLLWSDTEPLRKAIDDLEFLRRLGDGTLTTEVFRVYIEQDALYLSGYARALALLAARAPDADAAGVLGVVIGDGRDGGGVAAPIAARGQRAAARHRQIRPTRRPAWATSPT